MDKISWIDFYLFLALLSLFIYVLAVNYITILHKAYLAFHFMLMIWPFSQFVITSTSDQRLQWIYLDISFVSLSFLGFSWLIFSLVITRKIYNVKSSTLYLLALPAVISASLVITNPWHLMFARACGGWSVRVYGLFFWFFIFFGVLYLVFSAILMVKTIKTCTGDITKKQLALCLLGLALMMLFTLLDVLINVVIFPGDAKIIGLTSLGTISSAICFVLAIQKYDLFKFFTIAQRQILDNMTTGIIFIDNDGIVIDMNKTVAGFMKIKPGDIFDEAISNKLKRVDNIAGAYSEKSHAGCQFENIEAQTIDPDGSARYVSIDITPVYDSKKNILGKISTFYDVTELRNLLEKTNQKNIILSQQNKEQITKREQLEQEMARMDRLNLVGEMAAGIGHEIRNPMTVVRGYLQFLGEKKYFEEYKDRFELMISELDRANDIISNFLTLARNKKADLNLSLLNINNIITAMFPLMQADAFLGDKNIDLELRDIPDLFLDKKEILQLILNLSRNGLEAMSPGGLLTIKTFIEDEDVVLAVQDHGKGIEPDVLEKIGSPFFTTKDNGTGLGLVVCYGIAARHKARINIETSSSGTTFFVRFKRVPSLT